MGVALVAGKHSILRTYHNQAEEPALGNFETLKPRVYGQEVLSPKPDMMIFLLVLESTREE